MCTAKQMGKVVSSACKDSSVPRCNLTRQIRESRCSTGGAKEDRGRARCGEDISFRHATCIREVLNEFKDVFPTDLPPGLPPVRKGHEFCIDLEDTTAPVHKPIYKLSPLDLEELSSKLTTWSSMDISDHRLHPMDPQSYSYPKMMEASGFV